VLAHSPAPTQGMWMSRTRQWRRTAPGPAGRGLTQPAAQPFSCADLVLLCSFGPDLASTRTHHELHDALLLAGYRGALPRHLIATSPLLDRYAGNRYALHRYDPDITWNPGDDTYGSGRRV
jgi:hypothetical protein